MITQEQKYNTFCQTNTFYRISLIVVLNRTVKVSPCFTQVICQHLELHQIHITIYGALCLALVGPPNLFRNTKYRLFCALVMCDQKNGFIIFWKHQLNLKQIIQWSYSNKIGANNSSGHNTL